MSLHTEFFYQTIKVKFTPIARPTCIISHVNLTPQSCHASISAPTNRVVCSNDLLGVESPNFDWDSDSNNLPQHLEILKDIVNCYFQHLRITYTQKEGSGIVNYILIW